MDRQTKELLGEVEALQKVLAERDLALAESQERLEGETQAMLVLLTSHSR
jgi:hypothetical protein